MDKSFRIMTYEEPGWSHYKVNWWEPHRQVESLAHEIKVVEAALETLVAARILPHATYDNNKFLAHRQAVRERFDIPWTAITPRMQRLLYAINAIAQPKVMVAIGVFCGNTFISNAGAAIGPGKCYQANRVIGIEIRPDEAERARRNVATLNSDGVQVDILGEDGIVWLQNYTKKIDLLYIDADGPRGKGKSIYLDILEAGLHTLCPGSLVLAHNSVNSARQLADYLTYVRHPDHFRASANMIVDDQGLEVSLYE
jgi:predicted O-methyltransferase YrrM